MNQDGAKALTTHEGDILVVTSDNPDTEACREMLEHSKASAIVFLRCGDTVEGLGEEEMRRLGWQRIPKSDD